MRSVGSIGIITSTLFAGTLLSIPALAQDVAPGMVDIAPCMTLTDNTQRYACYDRLEAAVREKQQSAAPNRAASQPQQTAPDADRTAATRTVDTRVEGFGTVTDTREQQQNARVQELVSDSDSTATVLTNADGEAELHDTIAAVREREPGRYLITLASGQVWYQTNSQRSRQLFREGASIRIYRSPLGGSWRMASTDETVRGFIQVERVE